MIRSHLLFATLAVALAACGGTPASPTPSDSVSGLPSPTPTVAATPTRAVGVCSFAVADGSFKEEVRLFKAMNQDNEVDYADLTLPLSYFEVTGGLADPQYRTENEQAIAAALEQGAVSAGANIVAGSLVAALESGFADQPLPSREAGTYVLGFARAIIATVDIADCPDLRDPSVVSATSVDVKMRSTPVAYLVRRCSEGALTAEAAEALFSGRKLDADSAQILGAFHKRSCAG